MHKTFNELHDQKDDPDKQEDQQQGGNDIYGHGQAFRQPADTNRYFFKQHLFPPRYHKDKGNEDNSGKTVYHADLQAHRHRGIDGTDKVEKSVKMCFHQGTSSTAAGS